MGASSALLGRTFNHVGLASLLPGWLAVNPVSAVTFVAAGASLWLAQSGQPPHRPVKTGALLGVLVTVVGLVRVLGILTPWDLRVDQIFFNQELSATLNHPANRMALNTALGFVLLGISLVGLHGNSRSAAWASRIGAFCIVIPGSLALLGYLYGVSSATGFPSSGDMVLATAFMFTLLGIGVVFAHPDQDMMAVVSSNTVGGGLARRLLPAAIGVPATLGWLLLKGQQAGLYNVQFGLTSTVAMTMLFMTIVIWLNAQSMQQADLARQSAERERTQLLAMKEAARAAAEQASKQLEQANQQLFEQSRQDALTQLGNRLRLQEDLYAMYAQVQRYRHSYAVLLFDIDNFKLYNDRYGHQAGDDVLRSVAQVTRMRCRAGDTAYRYGGEEFLLILPEQSIDSSRIAAERLRREIEALAIPHEHNMPWGTITLSVGTAIMEFGTTTTVESVLKEADEALYRAKEAGRNRIESAQPASELHQSPA